MAQKPQKPNTVRTAKLPPTGPAIRVDERTDNAIPAESVPDNELVYEDGPEIEVGEADLLAEAPDTLRSTQIDSDIRDLRPQPDSGKIAVAKTAPQEDIEVEVDYSGLAEQVDLSEMEATPTGTRKISGFVRKSSPQAADETPLDPDLIARLRQERATPMDPDMIALARQERVTPVSVDMHELIEQERAHAQQLRDSVLTLPEDYTTPDHQLAANAGPSVAVHAIPARQFPSDMGLPKVMVSEEEIARDTPVAGDSAGFTAVEKDFFGEGHIHDARMRQKAQAIVDDLPEHHAPVPVEEPGFFGKIANAVRDAVLDVRDAVVGGVAGTVRHVDEREDIALVREAREGIEDAQQRHATMRAPGFLATEWAHTGDSEVEAGFRSKMGLPAAGSAEQTQFEQTQAIEELKATFAADKAPAPDREAQRDAFEAEMAALQGTKKLGGKSFDEEGNVIPDNSEREAQQKEAREKYQAELEEKDQQRLDARKAYKGELEEQEQQRLDARSEFRDEVLEKQAEREKARADYIEDKLQVLGDTPKSIEFIEKSLLPTYNKKHPRVKVTELLQDYDAQHPAVPVTELLNDYDSKSSRVPVEELLQKYDEKQATLAQDTSSDIERGFKARLGDATPGLTEVKAPGPKLDLEQEMERLKAIPEGDAALDLGKGERAQPVKYEPLPEGKEEVTHERPSFWKRAAATVAFVASTIAAAVGIAPRTPLMDETPERDIAAAKADSQDIRFEHVESSSRMISSATRIPADAHLNNPELESMRKEMLEKSETALEKAREDLLKGADHKDVRIAMPEEATLVRQEGEFASAPVISAEEAKNFAIALGNAAASSEQLKAAMDVAMELQLLQLGEGSKDDALNHLKDLNRTYMQKAHEGNLLIDKEDRSHVEELLKSRGEESHTQQR